MRSCSSCRAMRAKTIRRALAKPDPLVCEALEYFGGRRRFRPGTLRTYKTVLRELSAILGSRTLTEATREDLLKWHQLQDAKGNGAGTIIRKQGALRSFYKWLIDEGRITKDPTSRLVKPKAPERLAEHLTASQVGKLYEVLRWDSDDARRQTVVIKALYYTGLRAEELLGLKVEDWDRDNGLLKVRGKGDRERVVPVAPRLAKVLLDWMKHHPTGEGPFLVYPNGWQMRYQALRVLVKKAATAAGLPGVTAKTLRHTYATSLLRDGVPLEEIQLLLGHSHIQTTLIYAHVRISHKTRDALNNFI